MGFLRVYRSEHYVIYTTRYHSSWDLCFIIGFSGTVWIKMRSLAGSLDDVVLDDAILIPPRPPIPPTNIRTVSCL